MNPRQIVIITDEESKFLRTEAVQKAIEYEENYLQQVENEKQVGWKWVKKSNNFRSDYTFFVTHTATTIEVVVTFYRI